MDVASAVALTVIVLLAVPCWPSSSVAVKLTVYVPSSVGLKLNVDDVPGDTICPLVSTTFHAYVIGVSASTPSVTVLPRLIGVPTGFVPGAPVMLAVGA